MDLDCFLDRLLAWFAEFRRSLPWRERRSVYGTLVSEFMLQQTQVKTVLPYYEAWMKRFPDFSAVARAPLAEVLKHWEGLGYYTRARNLQRACQMILERETLPDSPEQWKSLPGIGDYTSTAIASIGQNYDAIVIDGNVIRLLSRVGGLWGTFENRKTAERAVATLAGRLVRTKKCGEINEALMEMGALICTAKDPKCRRCPVHEHCESRRADLSVCEIPRFRRPARRRIEINRLWLEIDGRFLMMRSRVSRLKSLFELPKLDDLSGKLAMPDLQVAVPIFEGCRAIGLDDCREKIFQFPGHNFSGLQEVLDQSEDLIFCDRLDFARLTISAPHRRWIERILANGKSPSYSI